MSAPTPPTPDKDIDPLVLFGHKLRDDAELLITRYRISLVVLVALFAFIGYEAFRWHERKLARLEAQASVEETRATNEATLADAWKTRALTRVDSFRVDTVRVRQIITHTKTVLVPAQPAPVADGVTYSVPLPLVPVPMVARADFDSLGAACTRTQHDCASALAAKDSVIAHADSQAVALAALNANTAKQLGMAKRAAFWQKLLWGAAGIVIGRAIR